MKIKQSFIDRMKALDLYKFIHDNNIEYHWDNNNNERDVIIFPYTFQIERLNKLLPSHLFEEEGVPCFMKDDYFAIWMFEICEACDIELTEVFGDDTND